MGENYCNTAFENFLFIKMSGKVETSLESSNEMCIAQLYWEMTVAKMSLHLPKSDEPEMTHITSGIV